MHIKEPLLLIGKSSPRGGGSGFHLSPSEWSYTKCPMPCHSIKKLFSAALNKTFPSTTILIVTANHSQLLKE